MTGGGRFSGGGRYGVLTHRLVDGVLVGETVQRPVSLSSLRVDAGVPEVTAGEASLDFGVYLHCGRSSGGEPK